MKLKDKVALITGGSRGIGLGCAKVFLKYGCTVVICSDREDEGTLVAKELATAGTIEHHVCDVTQERSFQNLIESTVKKFGMLNCLVNNVGWHPPAQKIEATSVEDFEKLIRLNLTST